MIFGEIYKKLDLPPTDHHTPHVRVHVYVFIILIHNLSKLEVPRRQRRMENVYESECWFVNGVLGSLRKRGSGRW